MKFEVLIITWNETYKLLTRDLWLSESNQKNHEASPKFHVGEGEILSPTTLNKLKEQCRGIDRLLREESAFWLHPTNHTCQTMVILLFHGERWVEKWMTHSLFIGTLFTWRNRRKECLSETWRKKANICWLCAGNRSSAGITLQNLSQSYKLSIAIILYMNKLKHKKSCLIQTVRMWPGLA